MKLAEELREICNSDPMELYVEALKRDLRSEALEGGIFKIVSIAPNMYNDVCQMMMDEGFEVMIYNYKEDNPTHYVYIIWDSEKFHELINQNLSFHNEEVVLHYGLI